MLSRLEYNDIRPEKKGDVVLNNNYILQSDKDMLGDSNLSLDVVRVSSGENIDDFPIAMAYVPWQKWNETYSAEEALEKGTVFPELYLPFRGKGVGSCDS